MNLSKIYKPETVEDKIYQLWEKSGFFNPDNLPKTYKTPYVIMMAPPNITGDLHIGQALENILSDISIRYYRLRHFKTLFLPGKDHAGIAAQYVMEKELGKKGLSRYDLGQKKFSEKMWQWMKKYGENIDDQLKKLGISCDWLRKRFTLDKEYQKAVKVAFNHYYKKGWIYQGKRIINWCPRCQTSLSDLELEHKEEKGKLWYIRYPLKTKNQKLKTKNYITVATTRPETMLGDSAVAVNPKDKKYKKLVDKKVLLPLVNREIPIIADKLVNIEFGTGAVKVTPAHDFTDFEIGQRHQLPSYKVIDKKGRMTGEIPNIYQGLNVLKCREKVIENLKNQNLLEKVEEYAYPLPYCYRCNSLTEPLISRQWFLRMAELSKKAVEAAKTNKIKFIPPSRKKIYLNWFGEIKDWCVSRQLWWGHKIPIKGVDDVLDTWFSSALWPFATLGWPKKTKDLKKYYPTNVISSAREIFYLWISRMVFSGIEFTGEIPFQIIYTHPTVLDKHGSKMSKSLGNVINPLYLIEKYGADAVRFGLAWQVTGSQDICFNEGSVLMGKKFCNKIWNASRFILTNKPPLINADKKLIYADKNLTSTDKKMLRALKKTIKSVTRDLENFRFGQGAQSLYHFFWHNFCDVYIEKSKQQTVNSKSQKEKENTLKVLLYVLLTSLKLLHPFVPFITEEIYQKLPLKNKKKCLMIEKWPNASV